LRGRNFWAVFCYTYNKYQVSQPQEEKWPLFRGCYERAKKVPRTDGAASLLRQSSRFWTRIRPPPVPRQGAGARQCEENPRRGQISNLMDYIRANWNQIVEFLITFSQNVQFT